MKVRATLRLQNEIAIACREKLGLSQVQVAKESGVDGGQRVVSSIECLRFDRVSVADIDSLATFYSISADALVPPELRGRVLQSKMSMVQFVSTDKLLALDRSKMLLQAPSEAPVEEDEMRSALTDAIGKLTGRQQEVIKMRYGLDRSPMTRKEVAKALATGIKHVKNVEMKALDTLRQSKLYAALTGDQP